MMSRQAAVDKAQDMLQTGKLPDTAAANVEIVKMMGVQIVSGKMSRDVRSALNGAVKIGRIGHLKKDGLLPEAYFHPNSKSEAIHQRKQIAAQSLQSILKTCI
jgi:hypothetical protein